MLTGSYSWPYRRLLAIHHASGRMPLGEADTRAKLIDPALHARGWSEDLIRREETAGAVEVVGERARRRPKGRVDYTLRVKVNAASQPVAVALLEAKAEHLPPAHGLEQAKTYAVCRRLNVLLAFASNGHQFVVYDKITGQTTSPRPLSQFPTPAELRARYEQAMGFSLESQAARPLLARYPGGEATRRYYQDAAIRAILVRRAGKSAPRALRLQVHRGGRRCRLPRRPPRRGPPPLHRHHGGPPHDGRGRPLRPEHPLLQVRSLAHRLRSEEHTSELQSLAYLVCRLLLEKKKTRRPISR